MTDAARQVEGPVRDIVGYGREKPRVRWPDDANVAVNIVVNYEEGSEYSFPAVTARTSITVAKSRIRSRRRRVTSLRNRYTSTGAAPVYGDC